MKTTLLFFLLTISVFGNSDKIASQISQVNKNFFIENKGQWPKEVLYLAKVGGMNAWITNSGIVYDYYKIVRNTNESETLNMTPGIKQELAEKDVTIKGHVIKMQLLEVNPAVDKEGNNKQESYYNYFLGNDKSNWASNVPLYSDIQQNEIYKNINVKYYFDGNSIRYDYIVKPGADISKLKLKFEGQESIRINNFGELVIKTSLGEVTNGKLYSYQNVNGLKKEVTCRFIQIEDGNISFLATGYDRSKELIIDPLIFSTFIGANNNDYGVSIGADSSGNSYLTGYTSSTNFPTSSGAYQINYGGSQYDAFVTKVNSNGSNIEYSTYFGGQGNDICYAIKIDGAGNAYLGGRTNSSNFPITPGAYQNIINSGYDAFITKLNSTGNGLIYSTFLGGGLDDYCKSLDIDTTGNCYITGYTYSGNFPSTSGAYQTSIKGVQNAFITKLNSSGNGLIYSTFLGGGLHDEGYCIIIDCLGNAYITGKAGSTDFPVTDGAFQITLSGSSDAFVTKLNPSGSSLIFSTLIGGSQVETGSGIAVDSAGNVYLTGETYSLNYPVTPGAFQNTNIEAMPYCDVFISKLNPTGSSLVYSTYLGGGETEVGYSVSIDEIGCAYITGSTSSSGFPTTTDAYQNVYGGNVDVFVTKLNTTGSNLLYSSFLGGANGDAYSKSVMDKKGNIYITGKTESINFPITSGTFQTAFGGGNCDAFITKLKLPDNPLPVELVNFFAKQNNENVMLNWETKTEIQNTGFDIERKSDASDWEKIGFVKGSGNSNHPNVYSFVDRNSKAGKFTYRLRQFDNDGNSEYSKSIEIVLSSPCKYELSQNYPNPFNPSTTIKYSIPIAGNVKLTVYNAIGSKVATIVNEYKPEGNYSIEFNGSSAAGGLASGIYLYRLEAGDYSMAKKLILLK